MSRFLSWFMAWARAFTAERRVRRKVRIISTSPSASLCLPVVLCLRAPLVPQEAGKPCTEGAGAFYPYAIQGEGEVNVLVGIHAQSEPYGTCGHASAHVFFLPSIGE
jgi:hypothetical protein